MKIEIDTTQPLSGTDRAICLLLAGLRTAEIPATLLSENQFSVANPEPEKPEKPAEPAPKKRGRPRKVAEPAPVENDEVSSDPTGYDEDVEPEKVAAAKAKRATETAEPGPAAEETPKSTIPAQGPLAQRAVQLIEAGERERVVSMLADLGYSRVRDVPDDKVAAALEALAD